MQAIKRAISLFLAGITALTMMCVGTISAGAEQTSKLSVEVSEELGNIIISLNGITQNDFNSAYKKCLNLNSERLRADMIAQIEFKLDKTSYYLTTYFRGNQDNIFFSDIYLVKNREENYEIVLDQYTNNDFNCLFGSQGIGYMIQFLIPDKYSKVVNELSACTHISAAFGIIMKDGTEPSSTLSDGTEWKMSSVSCDFSGLKKTQSSSTSNTTNTKKEKIVFKGGYRDWFDASSNTSFGVRLSHAGDGKFKGDALTTDLHEIKKNVFRAYSIKIAEYAPNVVGDVREDDIITVKFYTKDGKKYTGNVSLAVTSQLKTNAIIISESGKSVKSGKSVNELIDIFNKENKLLKLSIDDQIAVYACEPKDLNADDITEVEFIIERGKNSVSPQNNSPKKTTLTVKKTDEKYTFSWGKVSDADKYQIYYSTDGKKYTKLANVSGKKTSYSTTKLDESKTYSFKIRSYKKVDGKTYYSKFSKVVKK